MKNIGFFVGISDHTKCARLDINQINALEQMTTKGQQKHAD
jgi:hypothetical protein